LRLASFRDGQYVNALGETKTAAELTRELEPVLLDSTLIRTIPKSLFDVDRVMMNKAATASSSGQSIRFTLRRRQLPGKLPSNWQVTALDDSLVEVQVAGNLDLILPETRRLPVSSAGVLPTGFEPGTLYPSRNHPRALQMTIYAASDALNASGIDMDQLLQRLAPDQIAVYASNSIGQLDDFGFGGLTKFPAIGKRITSKQMPLGYAQMPADFVSAYMLGNLGTTGAALGACATFLYNLRNGVEAIRTGKAELVLVGGSDAPVTPEIIEGFRTMGALAEDKQLQALDGLDAIELVDHRKACRPFGNNCGFTIGESSQFIVLMSDRLAIETGASIHGSIPDVYVHADGYKKSISAPGVGNYLTLGKAASLISKLLGEDSLQYRSMVQAHGAGTPQNRVTESHVINEIAKAFGIGSWTVSAVKAYLGHSQGTAGGDQLFCTLGIWDKGIVPGLTTTRSIADDVHRSNLNLPLQHLEVGTDGLRSAIVNAKGFGGNNASACVLSPAATLELLKRRHSASGITAWQHKNEAVQAAVRDYDSASLEGEIRTIYRYDHNVLTGEDLEVSRAGTAVPTHPIPVSFDVSNPYSDLGNPSPGKIKNGRQSNRQGSLFTNV